MPKLTRRHLLAGFGVGAFTLTTGAYRLLERQNDHCPREILQVFQEFGITLLHRQETPHLPAVHEHAVIVISDLHLCSTYAVPGQDWPFSTAEGWKQLHQLILNWSQQAKQVTLVYNGDILEYRHRRCSTEDITTFGIDLLKGFQSVLPKNVQTHYIAGNHDRIRKAELAALENCGIFLHQNFIVLEPGLLISHGDVYRTTHPVLPDMWLSSERNLADVPQNQLPTGDDLKSSWYEMLMHLREIHERISPIDYLDKTRLFDTIKAVCRDPALLREKDKLPIKIAVIGHLHVGGLHFSVPVVGLNQPNFRGRTINCSETVDVLITGPTAYGKGSSGAIMAFSNGQLELSEFANFTASRSPVPDMKTTGQLLHL